MTERKAKAKAKALARFPPHRTQNVRRGPRLNARYPTLSLKRKDGPPGLCWSGRVSGAEEFVGGDGVFADADAGDADLADAACSEWIELCVGNVEDGDVDVADVGVDGDVVVGEVAVGGAAGDGVDDGGFSEGEADAPDDAAVQLIDAGLVVHERADVVSADDAADLDHAGVAIDGNLGEDGAEGLRGVVGAVGG